MDPMRKSQSDWTKEKKVKPPKKKKGDIEMTKPKNKKVTISDLARLLPNSRLLPPDDPIFDEPPGILFTGGRINREADENKTESKRKEKKNG